MHESKVRIEVATSPGLNEVQVKSIKRLFDAEYYDLHGPYEPVQPYGYAPSENHMMGIHGGEVVGHVGWSYRQIAVGGVELGIGGVGGMLVSPSWRGQGVAKSLLMACVESMKSDSRVFFGYLGCRKEVVVFYEACGWQSVINQERYMDQSGSVKIAGTDDPLLIYGVRKSVHEWPSGMIDLRGRAW